MPRSLKVFSPAKLNLYLTVAGKRPDGFHDLVSLAAPLDFGDDIELTVDEDSRDINLTCDYPGVPSGPENLAVQAAEAFRKAACISVGVTITLKKRIPMGAGLGGGSSNAAAVLRGLNELHGLPLDENGLLALAAEIGSDCPLFLASGPCIIRGRGEIVESVDENLRQLLSGQTVFVFKPDFSINTGWAYDELASSRREVPSVQSADQRISDWRRGKTGVEDLLLNSFEDIVFNKFVSLPVILDRLKTEPSVTGGLLSGSGSACFVLLDAERPPADLTKTVREALGESAFCQLASLA